MRRVIKVQRQLDDTTVFGMTSAYNRSQGGKKSGNSERKSFFTTVEKRCDECRQQRGYYRHVLSSSHHVKE